MTDEDTGGAGEEAGRKRIPQTIQMIIAEARGTQVVSRAFIQFLTVYKEDGKNFDVEKFRWHTGGCT